MSTFTKDDPRVEKAARLLLQAKYAISLVGAGISVESGIPPFRGPGGLWTKYGEPDGRSFDRFLDDPKGWWQTYRKREGYVAELVDTIEKADPNPAHHALVDLEKMGILKHTISQNVDNLHVRAGSKELSEIHGNMFKLRCISCNRRFEMEEISLEELPPHCPHCGGLVKTDGVMFGEPIPPRVLDRCHSEVEKCDCMLLVGTSTTVYPAAGFPAAAARHGAHLIESNLYETPLSEMCEVVLRGPSAECLPPLVERIKELATKSG
jgi:NAD-dependent deacetylase